MSDKRPAKARRHLRVDLERKGMHLKLSKRSSHKVRRRLKIKARIRKTINGTSQCPRIALFRSNTSLYAQCIEDFEHNTLVGLNSRQVPECKGKGNSAAAFELGKVFGKKLIEKGVKQAVFDRSGYLYHGRVKRFAEGIREAGVRM